MLSGSRREVAGTVARQSPGTVARKSSGQLPGSRREVGQPPGSRVVAGRFSISRSDRNLQVRTAVAAAEAATTTIALKMKKASLGRFFVH